MARVHAVLAQHDLFRYWKEIKACKADAGSETDVFVSSTGSLKIVQVSSLKAPFKGGDYRF